MFSAAAAFGSVLALAFALHCRFGLPRRLCPVVSVTLTVSLLSLPAMAGFLRPGAYVLLLLPYAGLFLLAGKDKNIKEKIKSFLCPGVGLFLLGCACIFLFLRAVKPVMSGWDEFSFWGFADKLLFLRDDLYTFYPSSMLSKSIPPAFPLLTYFFGFLGKSFREWVCFFAYDVFLLACFCACTAAFGRDRAHLRFMMFAALFLLPYFFRIPGFMSDMDCMYITLYSDIPIGALFGRAVALFILWRAPFWKKAVFCAPLLVFLTLSKDMGVAFGCMALFIAFFEEIFRMFTGGAKREKKEFFYVCARSAGLLAAVALAWLAWSAHLGIVMSVDRSDFGGSSGMGIGRIVISGIKELLSPLPDERFARIKRLMTGAFFNMRISMAGSCAAVCVVLLEILRAAFLAGDREKKAGVAGISLSGAVAFALYYIFHLFLYVWIFRTDAYNLVSYDRYMYTFLFGRTAMALCRLSSAAASGKKRWGGKALCAVCLCLCGVVFRYVDRGNLFTSYDGRNASVRMQIERKTARLAEVISPEDVIYCHTGEDTGMRWMVYTYLLPDNIMPQQLFVYAPELSGRELKRETERQMTEYMKEKNVTHILVDISSPFWEQYLGDLFDVPMGYVGLDSVAYYKVNYTEDGFYCTLVKGGYLSDL